MLLISPSHPGVSLTRCAFLQLRCLSRRLWICGKKSVTGRHISVRELDYFFTVSCCNGSGSRVFTSSISLRDESVINNLIKIGVLWDSLFCFCPCCHWFCASSHSCLILSVLTLDSLFLLLYWFNLGPWQCRQYVPLKHLWTVTSMVLHPRRYKFRSVHVNGVRQT